MGAHIVGSEDLIQDVGFVFFDCWGSFNHGKSELLEYLLGHKQQSQIRQSLLYKGNVPADYQDCKGVGAQGVDA